MARTKLTKKQEILEKELVSVGRYTAKIRILGKYFEAKGYSVSNAISNLLPSGVVRGMSILTVSNGEQSKERVLPPIFTNRLFSKSKLTREIALKNTSQLFDL